jgi:hypothetical protein
LKTHSSVPRKNYFQLKYFCEIMHEFLFYF